MMKRIALALLAVAGFATTAARADRVSVNGSIHIGSPGYPGYYEPAPVYGGSHHHGGHWRDITEQVWIPGRWITHFDRWGRQVSTWQPGHTEYRTRRVWVDGRRSYRERHQDWHGRNDHRRGWGWGR